MNIDILVFSSPSSQQYVCDGLCLVYRQQNTCSDFYVLEVACCLFDGSPGTHCSMPVILAVAATFPVDVIEQTHRVQGPCCELHFLLHVISMFRASACKLMPCMLFVCGLVAAWPNLKLALLAFQCELTLPLLFGVAHVFFTLVTRVARMRGAKAPRL
jgi:hypothetical protein